ncbi:unnamed protein product [Phytophthora fragariaefolia]|uniref:Unnamed protein product n=1 Tax=Phytophthora fragariaefolia TaxID=1490495 RepID=A0A9W6Y4T9_9STRA|nr:unnamed protein product [Phytophthora fragariaefolia]
MWSRLTEGLADMVAPEEGDEQLQGDEDPLWSRFAAVVAPPPASEGSAPAASGEEDEQEQLQAARNDAVALQAEEGQEAGTDTERLVQELQQAQAEVCNAVFCWCCCLSDKPSNRFCRVTQADALAAQCQAHEKNVLSLRDRVEELQIAIETLKDDEREARSRASEYEQGYMDLLAEIEKMKTANEEEKAALMAKSEEHASSIDSQRLYDLEARVATSEADKSVAQQDAERLQRDLNSLEGVLHQFQVDNKTQKDRVASLEAELEQARKELQTRQPLSEPRVGDPSDFERIMQKLTKKTRECEQLREGFTEEQKRRVGIGYPIEGNGGGGLFSSIIGLVAPGENSTASTIIDPSDLAGKSFADMWSEFLLDEASKGR